jgi:tRNA modification GTPase
MLPGADETIVALATAPGRGALAMVRVSGPQAFVVLQRCRVAADISEHTTPPATPPARRATLVRLHDPHTGSLLDEAIAVCYHAPHSFTGDDVVELTLHGGMAVSHAVCEAIRTAGARDALPGEFTRRAVMAGKVDILQAEAIADLIDARSRAAHQAAVHQLDGGLSRRIDALRDECIALEVLLAYDIDFPEEDDGPVAPARIRHSAEQIIASLDDLLRTAPSAELLREGAVVVLAGAPNTGKSSLFNALAGEARAIVTDIPGTTRDALDVLLDTPDVPLRLVDTAGLRETHDPLEQRGIEVSAQWLARAHLILACGDSDDILRTTETFVQQQLANISGSGAHGTSGESSPPLLRVRTKWDTSRDAGSSQGTIAGVPETCFTSAHTGAGLPELLERIRVLIGAHYGGVPVGTPRLTRARHRAAVEEARSELTAFLSTWNDGRGAPAIIAAVHVRAAIDALSALIGTVSVDDVLDQLFRDFCIGK